MTQKKVRRPGKRPMIFRAWITLKDGTKIWAKDYGFKAWPIAAAK